MAKAMQRLEVIFLSTPTVFVQLSPEIGRQHDRAQDRVGPAFGYHAHRGLHHRRAAAIRRRQLRQLCAVQKWEIGTSRCGHQPVILRRDIPLTFHGQGYRMYNQIAPRLRLWQIFDRFPWGVPLYRP